MQTVIKLWHVVGSFKKWQCHSVSPCVCACIVIMVNSSSVCFHWLHGYGTNLKYFLGDSGLLWWPHWYIFGLLSSKSLFRNPKCPQSTPMKDIPFLNLDTVLREVSKWNSLVIFLRVKHNYLWHQWWPCPLDVLSGTLNVLEIDPFLTPHFWYHF